MDASDIGSAPVIEYSSNEYYTKGCGPALLDFIHDYLAQIIAVVFATFAIEIVVLVFASILAYRIKVIHRNYTSMDEPMEDFFN